MAISPASQVLDSIPVKGCLLLGPSQGLIVTIFRVSTLTTRSAPCMLMDDSRRSELTNLAVQLQERDAKVSIDEKPSTTGSIFCGPCEDKSEDLLHHQSDTHDDIVMFELYRLACLVYVTKLLDPQISPRDPSLQQIVALFIGELGCLSGESPISGLLVWPVVVTGLCAVASTHQRIIIGRLRAIHKIWRTDILVRSMDFLREQWKTYRDLEKSSLSKTVDTCHHNDAAALSSYFSLQDLRLPAVLV